MPNSYGIYSKLTGRLIEKKPTREQAEETVKYWEYTQTLAGIFKPNNYDIRPIENGG